jgi:nitrile hydratase subunit beta
LILVDGIHDLGGMHGFGPVEPEPDEPVFHEPWEGRVFGLSLVAGANGLTRGSGRSRMEAMPPAEYLEASYYERWAHSLEVGLVEAGTLTGAEIDARAARGETTPTGSDATRPDMVALVPRFLNSPQPTSGAPAAGRFAPGDSVTVRRMAPAHHHRCPRYLRGVTGTVVSVPGAWPPAGEQEPEAVYTVRFANADLWGDDAEPGTLCIDLWERYLE